MITKRLFALLVVLIVGMSSLFLLPRHLELPEAGVILNLPSQIGKDWYGKDAEVTPREREILGPETLFARKEYSNLDGDRVYVSIVLSGEDMNTSIHRPERCLPAQGFTIIESHTRKLPMGSQVLTVTRLHNTHDQGGDFPDSHSLDYYWFVGSTETTESHLTREFIDVRDRLLKGSVQRWAYITVTSGITKEHHSFGRTEKETDELLESLIKQLLPMIEKPTVVNS